MAVGGKEAARSPRVTAALAKPLSLNDRDAGTYLYLWGMAGRPLSGPGSEYILKAVEVNPRYLPALLAYGQTLRRARRHDEAIQILRRATAAGPRNGQAARARLLGCSRPKAIGRGPWRYCKVSLLPCVTTLVRMV